MEYRDFTHALRDVLGSVNLGHAALSTLCQIQQESLTMPQATTTPSTAATTGSSSPRHHVVIVGGGFGGLYTALALKNAPVDVTLIDKRNFHLFQPLLYKVATGGLSPRDISSPIRSVLNRQKNVSDDYRVSMIDF